MPKLGTVALLPMKAHSERVPGKNFRMFAGKPLFAWILDTLLLLDEVDLIVINTDARSLLAEHGLTDSDRVLIRDRAENLCGDTVSMNLVIQDDIQNISADSYLMTHTTNPLITPRTILSALTEFNEGLSVGTCDSLFSVNRFQTRFYRGDRSPVNHDPNNLIRTQDLEVWYEENSNLYLFTRQSFLETRARIGTLPLMFETPQIESFDIDDQDGWNLAEIVAKHFLANAPVGASNMRFNDGSTGEA